MSVTQKESPSAVSNDTSETIGRIVNHYVLESDITRSIVTGDKVGALCGFRYVVQRRVGAAQKVVAPSFARSALTFTHNAAEH